MGVAEVYRKTKKKKDLFWNVYVCRPVAAVLVYLLRDSRVTPNQITLSAVFVALASAAVIIFAKGYVGLSGGRSPLPILVRARLRRRHAGPLASNRLDPRALARSSSWTRSRHS